MQQGMQMAWPPVTPMVKRIAIINAAIWLGSLIAIRWVGLDLAEFLYDHGTLQTHPAADWSVFSGEIWQLFTYMWLHDLSSPWHVIFNMLILWMFGSSLEERWGPQAFLRFYVISGVGAGVVAALAGLVVPSLFGYPIVGASGAVMAMFSATALVMPNRSILLAFVIPVSSRHLVWIAVGMDILLFLTNPRGFAVAAHLGRLLVGYLLVTGLWRPTQLRGRLARWQRQSKRKHLRAVSRDDDRGPWIQ